MGEIMDKNHIPGVYIYGALTILMLFAAALVVGAKFSMIHAIVCAACSYGASLAGAAFYDRACNVLWFAAVASGLAAFFTLIAGV